MALTLGNITGPTGTTQNIGGTTGRFRFAPIEDFDTIAEKVELNVATANDDLIEISDDHTFLTGKGWWEGYVTRDSGTIEMEMNQERDTTGMKAVYKARTPGAAISTHAILLQLANQKTIFMVEMADGQWVQLGSARFPAELKYKFVSGGNEKGYRGWELTAEAFDSSPAHYTGTFTMHP